MARTPPHPSPEGDIDVETLPLLRLEGLREVTVERSPCSLVFEFATDDGRRLCIRIAEFVQIVQFLQSEGAIPELPWDWVYSMGNDYGLNLRAAAL